MLLWKALSLIILLNSFLSAASGTAPAIDVYIKSEGCDDPGRTPNTCGIAYIKVNGKDYSRHGRGHNVVVVDSATGVILASKAFDTHGKRYAGNNLRDYLDNIKGNKIVLVSVQDEGYRYSSSVVSALERLGVNGSVRGSYRSSFAFAGYAGTRQPPWVMKQQKARYHGPSVITLKIPLSSRDYKCLNQTLQGDKGVIYSPNYPERYPDGQYCMWKIMLNASYQVALMFTHFSLQSENNTDAVYVYDGTNQTGKELGVFYGDQPPPKNGIYSSSNSLLVIFRSDKNGSFDGFQASFSAVKCSGALGMESGAILDAQISASSRMNDKSTPRQARLNFIEQGSKQGGWSSRVNDRKSWLQVDLGGYTTVTGVATQGRNSSILRQWITTYALHFSYDGVIFQLYKEPDEMSAKVFYGNQDGDTVVYNKLISPITARYIRLLPVTWHNHISLRMELYGCPAHSGCSSPLGMESQVISDSQITAFTSRSYDSSAKFARLNLGGWAAAGPSHREWLQVDLGTYSTVTSVATQGIKLYPERHKWYKPEFWTTSYNLQYSDDGIAFRFYKEPGKTLPKVFNGNQDYQSAVRNKLKQSITARYIRFKPLGWNSFNLGMRTEIYGCLECAVPLGMESRSIFDAQITASSQMDGDHSAVQGRLHFQAEGSKAGGWSALTNDTNQWLQVDFGSYTRVTQVATQGMNGADEWVTSYKLQYSDNGLTYKFYQKTGDTSVRELSGNRDPDEIVYNTLRPPLKARYFRIIPTKWNKHISMRIEFFGCPDCISPVGMESGLISDGQISASSQLDDNHSPQRARLNTKISGIKQGGWLPLTNDRDQWLQVDLGSYTRVTRVATQGRDGYDQWVTSFELQYSINEITFTSYKEVVGGNPKMFTGNSGSETAVYNILKPPITARYIRILPIAWNTSIAMRIEIYGCTVCNRPLGMESGAIKDAQITASTQWDDNYAPQNARLNSKLTEVNRGAWSSRVLDLKQWLQVDLGSYTTVTGVATQGKNSHWERVTKYRLQYSNDGVNFQFYKEKDDNSFKLFDGNQEIDSTVYHKLARQITARYIRFIPVEWLYHISMRLEIYGCEGCVTPLGMEDGMIPDIQVSSSSRLDDNHSPSQARLNFKEERNMAGGWSAQLNDKNPWLQVDLGSYTRVTRVATQGMNANDEWVTKYKLQYSDDGKNFQYYKQQGDKKWTVLNGNKGSDIIVENNLKPPVTAQFIRFIPTGWHNNISMRTEIYGCPACMTALGMENQAIEDAQISASSQLDGNHSTIQGRLHLERNGRKQGGWSALANDRNQWLQVDLNTFARVTIIATQGRHGFKEWVTKYSMQYSDDGVTFTLYKESDSSSEKVFDGNQDSDTVVYNKLTSPITARYIRLIPTTWNNHISMRMELYGCPGCVSPYGMENRKISDSQIKSSSQLDENHSAKHSRLHLKANRENGGSWSALKNDVNQWLQVDLGSYIRVTGIATQGRNGHDEWVTKFRLQYGEDEDVFHFFEDPGGFAARVFKGNTDSDTVVYNALNPPIITRYIRFKPAEWHNRISMRIEIYGCPVVTDSPTVPAPETTTEASTVRGAGTPTGNKGEQKPEAETTTEASTVRGAGTPTGSKGKRKPEGVNILAVVLPVVLSIILIAALGVFYWKRRAQKYVDIKSVSFQTGTNELNYPLNRIYDDGAGEVVYHDF